MSEHDKNINKKLDSVGSTQKGQGSVYNTPKEDPNYARKWEGPNMKEYKDAVHSKISALLLLKWDQIEPHIKGSGLEAIQKTYKEGNLIAGRGVDDLLVVHESDVDANDNDEKVDSALFGWLDFGDVTQLTLRIVTSTEVEEGGKPSPPSLILMFPDKLDFNLNEILGTMDLNDINLKDNVSQFMKLDKVNTNIDRLKLSQNVDTEFSELSPITFTSVLEQFSSLKKSIPFYRYRTDDFFTEYINSVNIPLEYRLEKFFEEFERIKSEIPQGALTPYEDIQPTLMSLPDRKLFGWETLTYLVKESQDLIGSSNPIYNQDDARSWWDRISTLTNYSAQMSGSWDICEKKLRDSLNQFSDVTGSLDGEVLGCTNPNSTNYNPSATVDDGSCIAPIAASNVYGCMDPLAINYSLSATIDTDPTACVYADDSEPVTGCMDEVALNYNINAVKDDASCEYGGYEIRAVGTGLNNNSERKLYIAGTKLYDTSGGRGLRMTVISPTSLDIGRWSGETKFNKTYDVYALDSERNKMADDIFNRDWDINDLFIITSYDAVRYNELLISALKTIGGCNPRLVNGIGSTLDSMGTGAYVPPNPNETVQSWGAPGDVRTPYVLVGTLGLSECGGWESVGDDGPQSPPASVTKIWEPTAAVEGGWDTDDPVPISGCTDPTALNFVPYATENDDSCEYSSLPPSPEAGCMDTNALNWDYIKNPPFDYCKNSTTGFVSETQCTDNSTCVSMHGAGWKCDGSCEYDIEAVEVDEAGCMRSNALNWDTLKNYAYDYCKNPNGFISQTKCISNSGCAAHGSDWTCDGSCEYEEVEIPEEAGLSGCTVSSAWNYNPKAIDDDGSCGCFETQKFKDLPPPYDVACQPGPEHPGNKNMSSCTCTYPNISVSWSRKSSNCTDYNFWNTKARCDCTCKSNKPSLVPNVSTGAAGGDCARSGDDDNNCKGQCNTWCAGQSKSISGKPVCASGETWNGSFCAPEGMGIGGRISTSVAPTLTTSTNIGPTDGPVGPDLLLPKFELGFGSEYWNPSSAKNQRSNPGLPVQHSSDIYGNRPKRTYTDISTDASENMRHGGKFQGGDSMAGMRKTKPIISELNKKQLIINKLMRKLENK